MSVKFVYTRQKALADGVLIDVSQLASEAGIRGPTVVTAAVWEQYVTVPENVSGQDETGRLWDIVSMLSRRIRKCRPNESEVEFQLFVRNSDERDDLVTLKAVCALDDDAEAVITIMLPHED